MAHWGLRFIHPILSTFPASPDTACHSPTSTFFQLSPQDLPASGWVSMATQSCSRWRSAHFPARHFPSLHSCKELWEVPPNTYIKPANTLRGHPIPPAQLVHRHLTYSHLFHRKLDGQLGDFPMGLFVRSISKISCWFPTLGASWVNLKLVQITEEQGRLGADPSKWPSGRYNNQKTCMKLVLGYKMWRPQHLPFKIFEVVWGLPEFSHICQPGGLNTFLSGSVQQKWPQFGNYGDRKSIFQGQRRGVMRALWLPRSSSLTTSNHTSDNLLKLEFNQVTY